VALLSLLVQNSCIIIIIIIIIITYWEEQHIITKLNFYAWTIIVTKLGLNLPLSHLFHSLSFQYGCK
jgi:hypothetical protein